VSHKIGEWEPKYSNFFGVGAWLTMIFGHYYNNAILVVLSQTIEA